MLNCFGISKETDMLIFLTSADFSQKDVREEIERQLTKRTGIKCVLIDCCDMDNSAVRLSKDQFYDLRKMLCQQGEYNTEHHKQNLKYAIFTVFGLILGLLTALFMNL